MNESTCIVCNNTFQSKRKDAKYCSAKCRQNARRDPQELVTDNVKVDEPVTDNLVMRFTTAQRPGTKKGDKDWDEKKEKIRTAQYWYDVPLSAVPIIEKGEPEVPGYMDSRQYFLWKKNKFKMEGDNAIIYNPMRGAKNESV